MALTYYLVITCPHCEEDTYEACGTFLGHNGYPAIPFDMAGSQTYTCDNCGKRFAVGEIEAVPLDV